MSLFKRRRRLTSSQQTQPLFPQLLRKLNLSWDNSRTAMSWDRFRLNGFEALEDRLLLSGSVELLASMPMANILGSSSITNNNVGGAAMGNAGAGILIYVEGGASIGPTLPGGSTPGLLVSANNVSNNGADGISVVARDSAVINDMLISSNTIDSNANDGVHITASEGASFNSLAPNGITDNSLTNNGANGINLSTLADGLITVDAANNLIGGNGANGIQATSTVSSAGDSASVTGLWSLNTITDNALDGIDLSGNFGDPQALRVTNNVIDGNGSWGVDVGGPGTAVFSGNQITNNGLTSDPNPGTGGGVNIDGAGSKDLLFTDNLIGSNSGQGMRIVNNGNSSPADFNIAASGNSIADNTGIGVNVINQGDAQTTIDFQNNGIASNGGAGLYVVNTASTTQDPDAAANLPLNADGAIDAVPQLTLIVNGNEIVNNGSNGTFSANGLVLRVGTSDGGYASNQDGGFADNNNNGVLDHGGVLADIRSNTLGGNFGDDVYIDSFVSTVDPATGTAWTNNNDTDPANDVFNPAGFEGDPLARLDLLWSDNTFDSINVTNPGAAYNNNDDVFKSRTTAQTPPGPFISGTRDRNAERLAARFDLNPNAPPAANDFLYSGLGQSTFRLLPGFDGTVEFVTDDFYTGVNSANGAGANTPPEAMPFGWNLVGGDPRPQ